MVRKKHDNRYEIISGHRRKRACEIAKISTIPAVIKELDDNEAAIMLVDSNLQRENLLPSERAYAYKLKLDAIKHQGKKRERTFGHFVRKSEATDEIGLDNSKSGRQIRRYIRLTNLIYQLLDKVDEGLITVTAGAEISYLDVKAQALLNDILEYECGGLTLKQAAKIRHLFQEGHISKDSICHIISADKIRDDCKVILKYDRLIQYFPKEYSHKRCEEEVWKILDEWFATV